MKTNINRSKLTLIMLFTFALPLIVSAAVVQFSFTTDEQTIKPNVISEALTIQAQNGSGEKENVTETMDLSFESTSVTGEFLNSSGNSVSKTMSKNTANRTFYYRDSAEGSHTLTVKITGRDSQQTFTTNQSITVSSSATSPGEETEGSSDHSSNTSNTAGGNLSVHASPAPINSLLPAVDFQVSAGRDRLVAVGVPLDFRAELIKAHGIPGNIRYHWSLGDGGSGTGLYVTHTYQYPGSYIVSLNARSGTEVAVSRLAVEVVPVTATIIQANSEYVEVFNSSQNELNLFGWRLVGVGEQFIFPQDTIIRPGAKVKFPVSVTKLEGAGEALVLETPHGKVVASWKRQAALGFDQLSGQIAKARSDAQVLASQMRQIVNSRTSSESPPSRLTPKPIGVTEGQAKQEKLSEISEATSSLAAVGVLYEAPVSRPFWRRLLSILPWW